MKLSLQRIIQVSLGSLFVFALPLYVAYAVAFSGAADIAGKQSDRSTIDDAAIISQTRTYNTAVFNEPVISVVFDDGWKSIYTNGFSLLEEYGVDTTQFIISDTYDYADYMSREQILQMARFGHEIGSHTASHPDLTTLDSAGLDRELGDSRSSLEVLLSKPVSDIASPLGAYNDTTLAKIKPLYRSHKTTKGGVNTLYNFDVYELRSPTIDRHFDVDDVKKLIEEARKNNGWLILTYHQIDESGNEYAVTPAMFEEHLNAITSSGIDIKTYGEVLDLIREQYQ